VRRQRVNFKKHEPYLYEKLYLGTKVVLESLFLFTFHVVTDF
jgi:hypothetical protein